MQPTHSPSFLLRHFISLVFIARDPSVACGIVGFDNRFVVFKVDCNCLIFSTAASQEHDADKEGDCFIHLISLLDNEKRIIAINGTRRCHKEGPRKTGPLENNSTTVRLHHAAHATHIRCSMRVGFLFLRKFRHHGLCGNHQACH